MEKKTLWNLFTSSLSLGVQVLGMVDPRSSRRHNKNQESFVKKDTKEKKLQGKL
jgi:hypothetical protein